MFKSSALFFGGGGDPFVYIWIMGCAFYNKDLLPIPKIITHMIGPLWLVCHAREDTLDSVQTLL